MKKMISVLTACVIAATAVCIGTGLSASADDAVHEHDYAEVETVDPTCEEAGYTIYQCTGCEATVTEYTAPTGHVWYYTNYESDELHVRTCATCLAIEYVPHNFTYESLGDGTHKAICASCGYELTESCSYVSEVVAATCTEQGYTLYTCEYCGYSYKSDYTDIDPENHDWLYNNYESDEQHSAVCMNCLELAFLDHNFTYESLGDGTHKVVCSDCGYERTEECSATDGNVCDLCGATISTGDTEESTTEPSTDPENPDETTTTPSEPDTEPSTEPDEGETEVTEPSTTPEEGTTEPSTDEEEETTTVAPEESTTASSSEESTTGSTSEGSDETITVVGESTTGTESSDTTTSVDESTTSSDTTETSSKVTDTDIPDTGAYESTFVCFALAAACTLAFLAVAFIRAKKKSARNSR